jgi:hypothetical protein
MSVLDMQAGSTTLSANTTQTMLQCNMKAATSTERGHLAAPPDYDPGTNGTQPVIHR